MVLAVTAALPVPAGADSYVIGDPDLQMTLQASRDSLVEQRFEVRGKELAGLSAKPLSVQTDGGLIVPDQVILPKVSPGPVRDLSLHGTSELAGWQLRYRVTGRGRITKTLVLTPKRDLRVEEVCLWIGASSSAPLVASTSVQDIAAFYRQDDRGMFVSLDFPYSRIPNADGITRVTYPPHEKLEAGRTYTCHSLTIGATSVTGSGRYGFDDGEVEAMDSYVQEHVKPRFERPMFVTTCINNRYTMPREDIIFYTFKDHPTLSLNQDLLWKELALMPKFGMEYYQLWPGPFDSVPGDPDPEFVRKTVAYARRHGMRIGDYSSVNMIFCLHYNNYRNSLENHPEWGIKPSDICLGNQKYVAFYRDMVVENDRKYGFEIHCLDFLTLNECNNPEHGHALGKDSLYAQVRGLVEILEGINGVSDQMMSWSNAGDWGLLLPKLGWWNHNMYLTDPFIASPWQGLNMTRLLDDARREQMVSLHHSRFVPYRSLTNCQYFFCQNSIVPDIRNYQYGALSTIAVTPNLCFGEVGDDRPWLNRLAEAEKDQVISFYSKWTRLLKDNFNLWKKTYQLGDNPGMGSLEIYSHASGNRGFIFVVNPQYWTRTAQVPLGESLGFSGSGRVEIAELHPVERLRLTEHGPFPLLGSTLRMTVPAQTVLVLEVRPAPERIAGPRLAGVPGTVEKTPDGYLIKTRGQQGTSERAALLLPPGKDRIAAVTVRDYPKQPKRDWSPTPVTLLASGPEGAVVDLTFRRDLAPTDLREWRVRPGSLADGAASGWEKALPEGVAARFPLFSDLEPGAVPLPLWDDAADKAGLGPIADFCGGFVENAFSEVQETWIDLRTGEPPAGLPKRAPVTRAQTAALRPLPELAKRMEAGWWAETTFHLPFMYAYACEPFFDEHTFLVLPFVRQARVAQVKAWINGQPLEVRDYSYPRNRNLACFYADLVGTGAKGGENRLVVYFERQQ